MSQAGYDLYGKTFLDSYEKFWSVPLTVYSEDPLEDKRFPIVDLNQDEELTAFLKECPKETNDYRFHAGRFAKKIFALTSHKRTADRLIWLDADVETFETVDEAFLKRVCPGRVTGSYLGRQDWHTSECGWVAYNLRKGAGEFLDAFRNVYTSGEIWDHSEWHDSYLFDRLRELLWWDGPFYGDWLNLSEGISGMHPWDQSPLGEKMKHLKGPLRKQGKTGNVPDNYWSETERAL